MEDIHEDFHYILPNKFPLIHLLNGQKCCTYVYASNDKDHLIPFGRWTWHHRRVTRDESRPIFSTWVYQKTTYFGRLPSRQNCPKHGKHKYRWPLCWQDALQLSKTLTYSSHGCGLRERPAWPTDNLRQCILTKHFWQITWQVYFTAGVNKETFHLTPVH